MKRISLRKAFNQGLSQWNGTALDKFKVRIAMAFRPDVRSAVLEFVRERAAEEDEPFVVGADNWIDLERLAQFLELLIKYLPLILEIILPLFTSEE